MFASLKMAREGSLVTKIALVLVYLGPHFFWEPNPNGWPQTKTKPTKNTCTFQYCAVSNSRGIQTLVQGPWRVFKGSPTAKGIHSYFFTLLLYIMLFVDVKNLRLSFFAEISSAAALKMCFYLRFMCFYFFFPCIMWIKTKQADTLSSCQWNWRSLFNPPRGTRAV